MSYKFDWDNIKILDNILSKEEILNKRSIFWDVWYIWFNNINKEKDFVKK